MIIYHDSQGYTIVEASKDNNTKQIIGGGKKRPQIMSQMFDQLLIECPTEQRSIKFYGCLLPHLDCTPMELSNPKGYVKLFRRDKIIKHPESPLLFKPRMAALLAYIWRFRLAIEAVMAAMVQSEYDHSEFNS